MDRVMVLSPHLDDEVLASTSFLVGPGLIPQVIYFTSFHPVFPDGRNQAENQCVVTDCGYDAVYLDLETNRLDALGQAPLIDVIERAVTLFRPDTVVAPFPSYNQDHRAVYEAAMTALRRHDRVPLVRRVLLSEQPETWDTMRGERQFRPQYFRPLDWALKARLMGLYASQLRGHRSLADIEAVACARGMQAGMSHAEAFEVVRWLDR